MTHVSVSSEVEFNMRAIGIALILFNSNLKMRLTPFLQYSLSLTVFLHMHNMNVSHGSVIGMMHDSVIQNIGPHPQILDGKQFMYSLEGNNGPFWMKLNYTKGFMTIWI
jgi:hypothetical protein